MPVDMGSVPQQDRQDYESRLKVYGLDLGAVQEPLAVTGSVTLGYGPRIQSARQPFVVQTKDFAAVKRMVGIDDRIARTIATGVQLPNRIEVSPRLGGGPAGAQGDVAPRRGFVAAPGHAEDPETGGQFDPEDLSQLDSEAVENIRLAARAYVRGNSAMVTGYRSVIEAAIGTITIPVWALFTVKVAAGSVLYFGPGVHALVAYEIQIENGGMIRSRGHLTINCTRLVKPGRRVIFTGAGGLAGGFRPIFSE